MKDQTKVPAMAATSLINDDASPADEPFEFSRLRIKQMTGRDAGEREYLSWYRDACIASVEAATSTIVSISDGRFAFDAHLEALLNSQLMAIRFHTRALEEASQIFDHVPEISQVFCDAHKQAIGMVNEAYLHDWQFRRLCAPVPIRSLVRRGATL